MRKELIKIKKLNYYLKYNDSQKQILKNIDFSLFESENVCILGQTGCGKSTLVKLLVGLIPDNAFYTYDVFNNCSTKIGLVLQDSNTSLNPTLKVRTQFNLFLRKKYKKISQRQINKEMVRLLENVNINNIDDVLEKYPLELSRGMNQRITIALALINEPSVLILDEPTSSIDASNRELLLDLVLKLKKKYNMTLIYVTHDLKLAEDIADRILVMHDGTIIEEINKKNRIFDYKDSYSKKLKDASNLEKNESSSNESEKILDISNLSKSFNKLTVLNNFNLSLYRGETLGIIGPSGCGKSTICKILMGIYNKDSGLIINYYNMTFDLVNQDAKLSLDPNVKIVDILNEKNYIKKNRPFTKKEIAKILKEFNLSTNILYMYPNELSGGQRQLILIVRAILYNTDILILDEPTSSLDVLTQKIVLDKLKLIKRKFNLTYIFISHDKDVIKYMCDRVININN